MVESLRVFLGDDVGAVTTEFVLWAPAFMFLLTLVTDASILSLTRPEMFNVSRDAAHQSSVGSVTLDEVPGLFLESLLLSGRTYTVSTLNGSQVIVTCSVNVGDASVFGMFEPVLGRTMSVSVEMRREPTPVIQPTV